MTKRRKTEVFPTDVRKLFLLLYFRSESYRPHVSTTSQDAGETFASFSSLVVLLFGLFLELKGSLKGRSLYSGQGEPWQVR